MRRLASLPSEWLETGGDRNCRPRVSAAREDGLFSILRAAVLLDSSNPIPNPSRLFRILPDYSHVIRANFPAPWLATRQQLLGAVQMSRLVDSFVFFLVEVMLWLLPFRSLTPAWEEVLLFNDMFSYFTGQREGDPKVIVFFEVRTSLGSKIVLLATLEKSSSCSEFHPLLFIMLHAYSFEACRLPHRDSSQQK